MLNSFSLLSQDLMIEILSSDLSMTDITRFLGCSKELRQWNVPTFQDQLLMRKTDSQVQTIFEEAAGLDWHPLVNKLLQPRFLARLGDKHIATTFLQAVRIRRSVARVIMPFCRCSVMKTSLDVLKVSLKDPCPLNLRRCELRVHGSDFSMKFTANMRPARLVPGSLDCVQWPLDSRGGKDGVIFWLNAPKDCEEWTSVSINVDLEHAWLNLHCGGIPEV